MLKFEKKFRRQKVKFWINLKTYRDVQERIRKITSPWYSRKIFWDLSRTCFKRTVHKTSLQHTYFMFCTFICNTYSSYSIALLSHYFSSYFRRNSGTYFVVGCTVYSLSMEVRVLCHQPSCNNVANSLLSLNWGYLATLACFMLEICQCLTTFSLWITIMINVGGLTL